MAGKPVEFMATVTGPIPPTGTAIIPTGSVQFGVDGTNSGSPVTLVGGMATSTTISNLAVGNHTVTATYPANNSNLMANSDTLEGGQLVNPASTTTTVTSSANASVFGPPVSFTAMTPSSTANPSVAGKPVEFMATVTGPIPPTGTAIIPTGSVQFGVDGTNSGSPVTLVGGMATSTAISNLVVGNYTATTRQPHGNHTATTRQPHGDRHLPCQQQQPHGQLRHAGGRPAGQSGADGDDAAPSGGGSAVVGKPVVYTATVSVVPPGTPTRTVAFFSNGILIPGCGAQPLSGTTPDSASCATPHLLPVGTATVTGHL